MGSEVSKLQTALNGVTDANGNKPYNLTVDGIYGRGTEAAVKAYQRDNGLRVDGRFGPLTRGKMFSENQPASVEQPVSPRTQSVPIPAAEQARIVSNSVTDNTPIPRLRMNNDGTTRTVPAYNKNDDPAEYLTSLMTSPDEEKRLREASMNRRKVLAIGDALRHIGNIYNASRYAPSQQFSSPVKEEEARYDKERAVRDSRNMKVLSYQQARARQEELARRYNAELEEKRRYHDMTDKRRREEAEERNKQKIADRIFKAEEAARKYQHQLELKRTPPGRGSTTSKKPASTTPKTKRKFNSLTLNK